MSKKESFWWENFKHRLGTILTLILFKYSYALNIVLFLYFIFRILLFPYFLVRRLFVKPTIVLNNLNQSIIRFIDLPPTIQQLYENEYQIHKTISFPNPSVKKVEYDLNNLDHSTVEAIYYEANGDPWAGSQYFVLNGQKFELFWQGNRQNPPYILFQLKFYYVNTLNPNFEELDSILFGVIDLSKFIKPKLRESSAS